MSEDSKEDVKHIELVIKFQDGGGTSCARANMLVPHKP